MQSKTATANIFEDKIAVFSQSQTTEGLWVAELPPSIHEKEKTKEVGSSVLECFKKSTAGADHPPNWRERTRAFFRFC